MAGFRSSSLRERIAVVFQDFVRYALPATDNIALGRIDRPAEPARVRAAAAAAGADEMLDALPHGYDTVLSRVVRRRHRPVGRPVAARRAGPLLLP